MSIQDRWLEQSRQQSANSPLVVHFARYKTLRQREVLDEIADKEKVRRFLLSLLSSLLTSI